MNQTIGFLNQSDVQQILYIRCIQKFKLFNENHNSNDKNNRITGMQVLYCYVSHVAKLYSKQLERLCLALASFEYSNPLCCTRYVFLLGYICIHSWGLFLPYKHARDNQTVWYIVSYKFATRATIYCIFDFFFKDITQVKKLVGVF